ncbi:MAG: tetratricopeptide repeat protein [Nitrospirota bacterium]
MRFYSRPIFHILLIVIAGILSYSNTFKVPFEFDDKVMVVENPTIKSLQYFIDMDKAKEAGVYELLISRTAGYLSFAINYKIHGLDVTGYHIFNLSVHIINALLIYWFVLLTFNTPYFLKIIQSPQSPAVPLFSQKAQMGIFTAVFSALFFAVHPIQTEAVTYIWQRVTSLATLFYLLSLVMYIKFRRAEGTPNSGSRYLFYLSSVFSAALSMKSKEIAFTLPVIITLYEFIFFDGKFKKRIITLIPLILTMLIIPLTIINVSTGKPLGDLISDASDATRIDTTISRTDYLFTQFRVIVTYIRLLFVPVNQNLDYDYPAYNSFFEPGVFLSFLLLFSILALGIRLFYRSRPPVFSLPTSNCHMLIYFRLISFGIFWFFITLSVESSFIPIVDLIFEHRVYLPSVGFFMALTSAIEAGTERWRERGVYAKKAVIYAMLAVALALSVAAYARNDIWNDGVKLWGNTVEGSPEKARPHYNLGVALTDQGRTDEAINEYKTAIRLNPDYVKAHYNLGSTYMSQGRNDQAIKEFKIVLALKPDYPLVRKFIEFLKKK